MKATTKELLESAFEYCQEQDKSIEFTLQYMQDVAKVDLDCVLNYITKTNKFVLLKHKNKKGK